MTVEFVWATPNAEAMITAMARVSAPQNQNNMETAPRLLAYLIKHKHWSPFEMANLCVRSEQNVTSLRRYLGTDHFHFKSIQLGMQKLSLMQYQHSEGRTLSTGKTLLMISART